MGVAAGAPNVGSSSRQSPAGGRSARACTPPPWKEQTRSSAASVRVELMARLGPHDPRSENDVRLHLGRLAQSALLKEECPIGPACFGPRIRKEQFLTGFTLPRDTLKYNGTAKLEDWLIDYTTIVGIARGNNVNAWIDFEESFVRNFTSTYKRPVHPRELVMCVQAADEPLHNYITRSIELQNSCEGVPEVYAIQYFIEGYRDGTLHKHKLMCLELATLAELMAKVDKYPTADSAMRIMVTTTDKATPPPTTPRPAAESPGQQNNKWKTDQPDLWYWSKKVATTEEEQPAAQATSQRQQASNNTW
ncbi:DNA mismatch repair protein Mlh1 [Hordeum vulgare]|nr:DNA mismatch repair protein Mlh1 [Hordeum vulgare]